MSDPFSPEPVPQELLEIPAVPSASAPVATARPKWIAPAWFFFGILVGVLGFALYTMLMTRSAVPTAAQPESVDSTTAMRSAAREGVFEAIATLQAGGPAAQQQQPQGPQTVASNAFAVREANRQGNPDAKVTIYEFSDFQ